MLPSGEGECVCRKESIVSESTLHTCSSPHLPVTPAQLMRPGIGQNVSCAVGDFA